MKAKWFIGIGALVLVCGGVVAMQKDNITALYHAVNLSEEEIVLQRTEVEEEVGEVLEKYDINQKLELTKEQTEKLLTGEMTVEEVTSEMIAQSNKNESQETDIPNTISQSTQDEPKQQREKQTAEQTEKQQVQQIEQETGQQQANQEAEQEVGNQNKIVANKTVAEDNVAQEKRIVQTYTTQMYVLEAKYIGYLEGLKSQGIGLLQSVDKESQSLDQLIQLGMPLVQQALQLEAQCNAEVNTVLENLEKELKAIGKDTAITGVMRNAYEQEKMLKKANYISLAKSML